MKTLFSKCLRGVTAVATVLLLSNTQAATYYVSANTGNDANNGLTETTPWKTIDKVNSVLFPNSSIILFKRGEVFRGAISALKSPFGLTFGAYGTGNNPVIAGSVLITGWKPTTRPGLNPKVYEAVVTSLPLTAAGVVQLFANGELMTIARYPNVDSPANKKWLKVGASAGTNAFTDRALVSYAKPEGYWNGATLRLRNYSWTYAIQPITNYNAATGKITAPELGDQLPEWGYFLDGKLEELDYPGEWYYDATVKKVYFYPKGGVNPNTLMIEGTTYETGLTISNQENNTTAENLTFRHFTGKGVAVTTSDNIIVRNCRFEHNVVGLSLWNSVNSQVTGNFFDHQLKDSVLIQAQEGFEVKNTVVANNQITNTAIYPAYGIRSSGFYQGLGISVFGKAYTVRQNTIDMTSHSGIYLKDGGHHLIENNVIRHSLALLNDGGAITIGSDGNIIRGNLLSEGIGNVDESNGCASLNVTPCNHHSSYGMGIGADNNFRDNVIEGNVIANNPSTGIRLNAYINTTVRNNILYNNDPQLSIEDRKGPSYNNVVSGNLFYSLSPDQLGVALTNATNHGSFDNNYYCNPYSEVMIVRDNRRYSLARWQTVFPAYDKNSKQCGLRLQEYTLTTVGANLILNPTFDKDVSNWIGSGAATISSDPSQAKLTGGSLKMVNSGAGYANVISNMLKLTANQTYRLKFSVVDQGLGNIQLRVSDANPAAPQILAEQYFAYDTNRKDDELIFKSPVTTSMARVLFISQNFDASPYWLDNVTVEPVNIVSRNATQQSVLFTNPTATAKPISLGGVTYSEVTTGSTVTGSITLAPFTAKILTTGVPLSASPLGVARRGQTRSTPTGVECNADCLAGNVAEKCFEEQGGIVTAEGCLPAEELTVDSSPRMSPSTVAMVGGIAKAGEAFQKTAVVKLTDPIHLAVTIKVEKTDVGKTADILVAGLHLADSYQEGFAWYTLMDCPECPQGWTAKQVPAEEKTGLPLLAAWQPLTTVGALPGYYTIDLYSGNFVYPGPWQIFFGYRVVDGTDQGEIIFNSTPISVFVEDMPEIKK